MIQVKRWRRLTSDGAIPLALTLLAIVSGVLVEAPLVFGEEAAPDETAVVDAPPGEIRFVGKNRIATANSIFHRWRVTSADIDPENLAESSVQIEIDVASLDTGIKKRDDHLRASDFFEVEEYPTATARFYNVRPSEEADATKNSYTASMDLRIRDIEKTQEIEFTLLDPEVFAVKGEFTVLRTDFGVGEPYKKLNPLSIQDEIHLSFEAKLLQAE